MGEDLRRDPPASALHTIARCVGAQSATAGAPANRSRAPVGEPVRVSTNRLESFSDGVFAVAITLLVLDLRVPAPGRHGDLGHALLAQWPQYAAYVTAFVTIAIIGISHHALSGWL